MYSTAQRLPNVFPGDVSKQISLCNASDGSVAFPNALTIKMPDRTRFVIEKLDASFTLKDMARALYDGGGVATRAFPPIELGRSFNFSFGGKFYPVNSSLASIHEEINLNACEDVMCKSTGAQIAADKLKSGTGLAWRVLNENVVMLDSNPYGKQADAKEFVRNALNKIPHLKHFIDVKIESINCCSVAEMRVADGDAIRMIVEGTPVEIGLAAPLIAQSIRNADHATLGMLPLDVLSRLGMFLAPELPDNNGYEIMQAEIDYAGKQYREAPVFRNMAPVAADGIKNSIAATAGLLLRSEASNSLQNRSRSKVSDVRLSNAGLTLDFTDGTYAGNFFRTMKRAGYQAASLEWRQPNGEDGECVARVGIRDLNEVKRFVETTCGFAENCTKELFETAAQELQLPSGFFIRELEAIGESVEPMTLEEKKAAAKRLMQAYLPYLDRNEVQQLKEVVWEKSRPDGDGNPGSLQYLREKRGAGRIFSVGNYSDSVATFKGIIASIEGLKD
jgi:hypothetical protein